MKLVFLGPPGSGKGTYASRLAKKLDIQHISTGDMLRGAIVEGTELGKQANEYMSQGKPVPNELVTGIIIEKLSNIEGGFIFDCPYNVDQAKATEEVEKIKSDAVININIPEEIIIRRLSGRRICGKCKAIYNVNTLKPKEEGICDSCGEGLTHRDDDKEEAVKVRLDEYKKRAGLMLEYYRELGKLQDITWDKSDIPEGEKDVPIETMLNKIMGILEKLKSFQNK